MGVYKHVSNTSLQSGDTFAEDEQYAEGTQRAVMWALNESLVYEPVSADLDNVSTIETGKPGVVAVANRPYLYDPTNTNYTRIFTNYAATVLSSTARTTSTSSSKLSNPNLRGAHFFINVSNVTGSASITVTIEAWDSITDTYYVLLTSAAIATVSTTVLKIYPGLTASAGLVANDILPRHYRVRVTHATADSITYSVSINAVA